MAKNPFSNTTNKKTSADDSLFQAVLDRSYQRSVESRRTSPAPSTPYQSKVDTTPAVDTAKRRQEIEARLKQIETEYSNTTRVLSDYQISRAQNSNAYITAKNMAENLKAEKSELERELKSMKTYDDDFFGQFGAYFTRGRLQEDESLAWNDYVKNPTEANKQKAQSISDMATMFQENNKDALADDATAPLISQSLAGYLPQLWGQTKASAAGGAVGGAAGAAVGSVVPVLGTAAGAGYGIKAGIVAGSGKYSYDTMRGAAYKGLLDAGVPEEVARAAANDEAVVSALIEMADTGVDIATLGVGSLIKTATKGGAKAAAKAVAKEGAEAAAESAMKKFAKALGGYGLNIAGEYAEEYAQETVSMTNQQRMSSGSAEGGAANLAAGSVGKLFDMTAEEREQAHAAGMEGAKIALMMGGATSIAANTANTYIQNKQGKIYNADIDALIDEGLQSDPSTEAFKLATQAKATRDSGGNVSNIMASKLAEANQRAIKWENAKADYEAQQTVDNSSPVVESSVETAPVQSRVSTIQTRLEESGMEATKAETAAKSIDRILSGDTTITNKDKDVLSVGNKEARAIFEEETGVKLPASNSSTRKTISDYVAQTALKQQKQESTATVAEKETVVSQPPVNVMSTEAVSQLKNSVAMPTVTTNSAEAALRQAAEAAATRSKVDNAATVQSDMTSLGTNGQRVYQKHLGNAKSVTSYSNAFQRYYDAGQIGLPFESIKTAYDDGADRGVLYEAYSAGQNDASVAQKGKPTITNKSAQKGKKKPSNGKGRFYDNRVNATGNTVSKETETILKQFARVFNVDIELVDSIADSKGRSIANGYYQNGKIVLAADSDNPLITVLKHEVTHHLQKTSPKQYKAFKDYVMKAYYQNSQDAMNAEIQRRIDLAALNKVKLTRADAMDEIVADATESFLTDRDSIDALVRENRSLAETILNAIRDVLKKIEAAMKGEKLQGYSDFMNADQLKQAEKMWVEALAAAAEGSEVGVNFAEINESSAPIWSLKSMKFDLLDGQMQRDLVEHGIMTVEESQNLMDNISKLIDDMSLHAHILDMNEEYSKGNRPFNVYKPNSDPLYKVSLDFSTLCKKRLMTQFVMESLQTKLGKALSAKEQLAIRSKLEEYGKTNQQIQVACALCYVEARRLKAPDQINRFLDDRTTILTDYFGKKNKEYKASVDAMADRMKVEMGYEADTKLKDLKSAEKKKINEAKQKMMKQYIPTAEEQKIIERANAIDNKEFLYQAGLTNLSLNDPVIYDAFVTHVRNATKSKALEGGVPYYYGDSKSVSDALIEAMNAENGLRHQSWSDFEIVHLLDNIAAVIELSVRKAKMHAYTKVPDFVKVNGKTGIMINLSLIPAGKTGIKDGKLDFSPTEGMDYQVAVDLRDQYHKTTGTIAIGIDDQQITMMLDDDTIDYVIPYHTSGMNAQLRKMAGISGWADYESFQSEKEIKGAEQGDCPDELWHKKPDFSEWFDTSKLDMSKSGVEIMREAAGRYLVLCEERGLKPKFSDTKKHTDFSKHENYWKLLIDRKMVDKDGNIIIQQAVRPDFDFDIINQVVAEEVANYDPTLLDSINERVSKEWESGGIKQREKELLAEEKKAKKANKKAAKVANGLLEQVVMPEGAQASFKDSDSGDYTTRQIDWAIDNGVISAANKADLIRAIDNEIYRGYAIPKAKDGNYIVESGNVMMFTNGDRHNPSLDMVVVLDDVSETYMAAAKEEIYNGAKFGDVQGAVRVIEILYWDGYASVHVAETYRANGNNGRGRKGNIRQGSAYATGKRGKRLSVKDRIYLEAVESGDLETAQRMVDEKANEVFADSVLRDENGNLIKVYHGSPEKFNVFRGKDHGSVGNYFSPWKSFAGRYGDTRAFYLNLTSPVLYDDNFDALNGVSEDDADGFIYLPEDMEGGIDQNKEGDTEIVVYDSKKIKSADPVTYDDDGNVIPLSERFNTESDDIRYSFKEADAAEERFGTTTDFEEAGFILPNGKMLKFTDDNRKGERTYDHRAIGLVYGVDVDLSKNQGFNFESSKYLNEFIENGGIRFEAGVPDLGQDIGLQLSSSVPLTREQEQIIRDLVEWKRDREERFEATATEEDLFLYRGSLAFHIDFSGGASDTNFARSGGANTLSYEGGNINADRIINDIRHYYRTGETRKPSAVAQFLYQLKTPEEMVDIASQIRHEAKAATDAEIMSQAIKDMKLTSEERTVIRNYQNALKKLAAYEQDLAVHEATKGEHGKGRSFYTDASGKVKKSGVKYSAAERADIQRKIELWKRNLRDIEQKENFKKILKREKAKMAERHAKEVADIRAKYDQRLSDLRAKRDEKVEAEKQKMRDYKQHQRDSKEYKALKSKLEADVNWLSERLVHPTESKHIPDKFRGIVAKFLETLDFTTERMDKNTAKTGTPSNKVVKLWSLVAEYQKIALDDGAELTLTPLEEDMVELIQNTVDGKKVEDLTYDELRVVRDIIRYIKIGVSKANGMFNAEIKETYSELGETLIEEQISKKRRKEFDPDSAMGRADKLLFYDNVTPADMFHRFGGVMEKLYNEIRKGFDKHIENVSTSMNYIQKLIDGYDVKKWANTAAEFKLSNGKTVELTQTQVMSLYCLMKREQAVGHILGSGIVPSGVVIKEEKPLSNLMKSKAKDVTLSDAERKQKEQAFAKRFSDATAKVSRKINENGSQVSFEDVQKIIGTLTADQKKVADGVMKFFVTKCADWGNETSLRMFDIKKFTEENYFPIKSSDAFLNERFDDSGDVLIKNTGFTKNTVVNANNPIVIDDIFNVFTDHTNKMSMYNALVVPLTDFTKVYNYKRKKADNTGIDTTVKEQIKAAYGAQATAYVTQFIKDVNRQANTLAAESFGAKNLARFKKAKIGANLRVLAQQPTSIVRAAAMVDPKYLTKGLAQKANYEEMFSNSEIALWKSWGFFQTDTSRGMKDILLGNESKLDKVTMGLYGKADDFAWGHLWNAIKLEQADAHPNMDTTSSEFLDLVAKRFEEVVDRTQVVDSVFHRSQLMRSNSVYVKMVTAFMAEGTKSYNLLMSAWTDMKNTGDKRKFTRVLASYVASAVATSWAAAWVDALRDDEDEDDEGNERDFITKQMDATLANMLDNIVPMNLVPYAKDIWSTFSGYDVTRTDMASYTNFSKAMRKVVSDKYGWPYKVKVLIDATADLFGIPVKNAARDVYGIIRTAGNAMGGWRWGDYFVEKSTHNISNPDNRSKFYKHYTDALLAGDEAAADKILMDMVVNGIPRDNIIAKGYQAEKNAAFSEARKLIVDGKADDAKKLIKGLAQKYGKKYTTLWKAVKSGDSADVPEETYEFKDLQNAVRKGEDTELIEDYLTEYGGYSEEDLEEAIKLLTEKYK